MTGGRDLLTPNDKWSFRWNETEDGAEYPDHEGAAVFTRPCEVRMTHALAMKEFHGARIVAELDDNYLAPGQFNLAMRDWWDADTAKQQLLVLKNFDAVVFSTKWLRDNYVKGYRRVLGLKEKKLPELHVCGNHVDPDDWPERSPQQDRVRVGWMGSPSHLWDLKLAYPTLLEAYRAGCEIVIIGHDPCWHPQTVLHGKQKGEQIGFEYTHVPWVDPRQYGRPKVGLPLDIGICPLRHDRFNLGRSDVKSLEYGISGAAVVATRTVYGDTLVHGETALLAQSREEILHQTMRLVHDDGLRERLAGNLQQYIREERLIEHHKAEWKDAVIG